LKIALALDFPPKNQYCINMRYLSLTLPGGQSINPPGSLMGGKQGGLDVISKVFRNTFIIMLLACVILSLIFIVVAGIQWIMSGGDKNKLQAARSKLIWAIGGLIVAFVAFFIVSLIGYLFKVDLLKFA